MNCLQGKDSNGQIRFWLKKTQKYCTVDQVVGSVLLAVEKIRKKRCTVQQAAAHPLAVYCSERNDL